MIEAMKQALEALEKISMGGDPRWADDVMPALRQAIEQAEKQDAWKPNDTAYRPGGLPQDFIVHEVENEGDWSEWVCPDPEQYFMKCCDCGLVHEMQFKVVKYSEGDECDAVDDPDVRGIFRARRKTMAKCEHGLTSKECYVCASPKHAEQAEKQEPMAQFAGSYGTIDKSAAIRIATALGWTPPTAQREWVQLTDEEIQAILDKPEPFYDTMFWFARTIERKLKEKNT